MAADKKTAVKIVLEAVDAISKPLREINKKITASIGPVNKLASAFKALSKESGIDAVERSFNKIGNSVSSAASSLWSMSLAVGAFAIGAVTSLGYLIKSTYEYAQVLDSASKKTSLSVSSLQELSYVASTAGLDFQDLTRGLALFSKSTGLAHARTGPLYALLSRTNPVLLQQVIHAKDSSEAFRLMSSSIYSLKNASAQAAYATAAFGRGGTALLPLFKIGPSAIDKMTESVRKFDLTNKEVAAGKQSSDTIKESIFIFGQFKNIIVSQVLPAVTVLFKRLNTYLGDNVGKIRAWAKEFANKLPERIERLSDDLEKLGTALGFVGRAFEFVIKYPDLLSPLVAILAVAIGIKLVTAFRALSAACLEAGAAFALTPFGIFTLAVGALSVAAYELYLHWDMIVGVWKEAVIIMEKMITLGGKWTGINWLLNRNTAHGVPNSPSDDSDWGSPLLDKGHSTGGPNLSSPRGSKSHITVTFSNAPKGTRTNVNHSSQADYDLKTVLNGFVTPG